MASSFDAAAAIRAAASTVEVEKQSLFRNLFQRQGTTGLQGIAEQVEEENRGWTSMPYGNDDEDRPAWEFKPAEIQFPQIGDHDEPDLIEGFDGPDLEQENYVNHRLINRYKATGDPEDLEKLYGRYNSLLEGSIRSISRRKLPEPAIRGKVYNGFKKAVDSFDESRGMQFHNYFHDTQLRGIRTWASQNQNFARVPKSRAAKQDAFRVAFEQFEQDHGREPTARELKQELPNYKDSEIRMLLQEKDTVLASSMNLQREYAYNESRMMRQAATSVRESLPPEDQAIFDDYMQQHGVTLGTSSMGSGTQRPGRGFKSDLAKRHGLTSVQISRKFGNYRALMAQEIQRIDRDT